MAPSLYFSLMSAKYISYIVDLLDHSQDQLCSRTVVELADDLLNCLSSLFNGVRLEDKEILEGNFLEIIDKIQKILDRVKRNLDGQSIEQRFSVARRSP